MKTESKTTTDLRELFGLCLEPGMPFPRAPFAGITADEIADAFAEEAMAEEEGRNKLNNRGRA